VWALLGLSGAVFHVWNHSVFKALLFLSAGSVVHASGTREMDRMGGLLRLLPRSGLAFGIGAAAVSGLPPLNGFVSEWLIYVALFSVWTDVPAGFGLVGFAIPVLAMTGALATASFVKVFGTVFLGSPRGPLEGEAHERPGMTRPLLGLASACVALGLGSPWLTPLLERTAVSWHPALAKADLRILEVAPLGWISVFGLFLAGSLAAGFWVLGRVRSTGPRRARPTWDCGYAAPTARMQYTGRSFGEWLGERLLPRTLGPSVRRQPPRGFFPVISRFSASTPDPFHSRVYAPAFSAWADRLNRFRWLQQGRIGIYLLYILAALVGLLAWSAVRGRWGA
jgi:hydrogenase-4 component B